MSEDVVGPAEREALDRARRRLVASRREYYRRLEDVAELDRLGVALQTGDRVVDRLVGDLGLVDRAEAKRWVDEAEDLVPRRSLQGELLPPRYPCTALALAEGRTGPEQVAVIRRTMARLGRLEAISAADLAGCERILAEAATGMPPRMLRKVAERLIAEFDPDGVAPPDDADRDDELRLVRRRDGSLAIKGRVQDPLDAETIVEVFDLLSTPAGPQDDRDLPRRHADALKDLAQHALGATGVATDARGEGAADGDADPGRGADGAGAGGTADGADDDGTADGAVADGTADGAGAPGPAPSSPAPAPPGGRASREPVVGPGRALLTITIDHRWLRAAIGHGTLDSGVAVDVDTVRRWACDAGIVPVVLGSRSEPLDVGRLSYTVPEAIRRALVLRDGGCAFPGCTRRPCRCHAHHVEHWQDGGPTALENLTLLCRFHHQLVHHGHWTVAIVDGLPWFTPPSWIDPDRQPRLGGRARVAA
ncbi:HNH endonuclease signature motif containing protein [Actinomycetospora straminea]|uniref:HNH nuclease domain-containing protein n=1 Tax=Actinomycetospora straminea TaxID=663607 RepID=A0ABP9EU31_9PSEU|nr:HNH endonuclease signature motif containing protein [Actinomycetospora straminea]MDD7934939.1 DUF222 domain-containing protein [Actinomycetospora straminea]